MPIPGKFLTKGKTVVFGGLGIDSEEILLENEVSFRFQSDYAPVVDNDVSVLTSLASSAISGLTGFQIGGTTKELGMQFWKGSSPISCSVELLLDNSTRSPERNARIAKILMKAALPYEPTAEEKGVKINFLGHEYTTLMPPGPWILDIFNGNNGKNKGRSANVSARVGVVNFPWIVIRSVEPTWSLDTDEEDNPLWWKLQMEFETVYSAYGGLIEQLFN